MNKRSILFSFILVVGFVKASQRPEAEPRQVTHNNCGTEFLSAYVNQGPAGIKGARPGTPRPTEVNKSAKSDLDKKNEQAPKRPNKRPEE